MSDREDRSRIVQSQALKKRRRGYRWGWVAEWIAAGLLICKGHRILSWRYRSRAGEIDLISRRGRLVSFVEVKSRPSFALADSAVTPFQKKRIFRCAELWMQRHPSYMTFDRSYDLISVVPWRGVRHHRQYFTW